MHLEDYDVGYEAGMTAAWAMIDCKVQMPPENKEVLVKLDNGYFAVAVRVPIDYAFDQWRTGDGAYRGLLLSGNPTHWINLPED